MPPADLVLPTPDAKTLAFAHGACPHPAHCRRAGTATRRACRGAASASARSLLVGARRCIQGRSPCGWPQPAAQLSGAVPWGRRTSGAGRQSRNRFAARSPGPPAPPRQRRAIPGGANTGASSTYRPRRPHTHLCNARSVRALLSATLRPARRRPSPPRRRGPATEWP